MVPTNTKTALAMLTIFKMARNMARVPTNTETALAMWPVSRWQETWPGYEQIPKRRQPCGPASNGKKHCQGTDKYRNGISYVASFKMAGNMARVRTNTKTALAMWTSFKWQETLPG